MEKGKRKIYKNKMLMSLFLAALFIIAMALPVSLSARNNAQSGNFITSDNGSGSRSFVDIYAEPYVGDGWVENGFTGLTAWRLYAVFDSPAEGVIAVFGNSTNPLTITSSDGTFHNDATYDDLTAPLDLTGGGIWSNQWDTYVTIGVDIGGPSDATTLTPGFASEVGNLVGNFTTSNAAWFVTPVDPQGLAGADLRVLIGQFVVAEGEWISGTANIQDYTGTQHTNNDVELVLDLDDFPMYEAESPYNEKCGPAVAQMTLDYIWWNSSEYPAPPTYCENQGWTQQWLYDRGIGNNTIPLDYLDLRGMWSIVQYNKPMPYTEYGYNFAKLHNPDQDEMLKKTCQWISYPVGTYGGHKQGHPLHVPAIVPAYGDYTNWMAVRGIKTDKPAYPMPDELTIYGFWVNDPYPSGIGENSYKDISTWSTEYYSALNVPGDPYNGEYVAIFEPPDSTENCQLNLAKSKPRLSTVQAHLLQFIRNMEIIPEPIQKITDRWIIQAAIDGVTEQLIPYDENFAAAFDKTSPGKPLFVIDIDGNDYYVMPFNIPMKASKFQRAPGELVDSEEKTTIVILISADDGHFKEASWVEDPVKYLPISKTDAQDMALEVLEKMGIEAESENIDDMIIELVHIDSTPYYPDWRVTIEYLGIEIFIGQDGTIDY